MKRPGDDSGADRPDGCLRAVRWLACLLLAVGLAGIGYQLLVNASGRSGSHLTLEGPFAGSYTLTNDDELIPFGVAITLSVVSVGAGAVLLVASIVAERKADRR